MPDSEEEGGKGPSEQAHEAKDPAYDTPEYKRQETTGWVAWSPMVGADLPDDVRAEAERRVREHRKQRGALLAVVEVRVFENGSEAQVSFPHEGLLGPDSGPVAISEVVAMAREELATWR